MQIPAYPDNESERVAELVSLSILDTPPEERFDRITRIAKELFNVPIALVSLVDTNRQWFKSCVGLDASETGRDISFCGHAILGEEVFTIENALLDERFADNPLVTGPPDIRFYAGAPIRLPSGNKIGTLCIIDQHPREFSQQQQALLKDLSEVVISELAAQQAATIDALTGIYNRRGFEILAKKALSNARRYGWTSSLIYFDLNKFKQINDNHGHAAGDLALIRFTSILNHIIRDSDIVARLGGDEFVVLLFNADLAKARYKVEATRSAIETLNNSGELPFELCVSFGIVEYDQSKHNDLSDLLQDGDERMYQFKQSIAAHSEIG